jgi:hypothetical protein
VGNATGLICNEKFCVLLGKCHLHTHHSFPRHRLSNIHLPPLLGLRITFFATAYINETISLSVVFSIWFWILTAVTVMSFSLVRVNESSFEALVNVHQHSIISQKIKHFTLIIPGGGSNFSKMLILYQPTKLLHRNWQDHKHNNHQLAEATGLKEISNIW